MKDSKRQRIKRDLKPLRTAQVKENERVAEQIINLLSIKATYRLIVLLAQVIQIEKLENKMSDLDLSDVILKRLKANRDNATKHGVSYCLYNLKELN